LCDVQGSDAIVGCPLGLAGGCAGEREVRLMAPAAACPLAPSTTSHTISPATCSSTSPARAYTFDTDRPAGQLRPLRAASAA
jgi:hypothetical protein